MTNKRPTVIICFMLRGIFAGLRDIIYPPVCLSCRASLKNRSAIDNAVCAECWSAIKRNSPPFCRGCGRHTAAGTGYCAACSGEHFYFNRAYGACRYDDRVKELIHAFKYGGRDYLGRTLGRLLADFHNEYGFLISAAEIIIPVPLHPARLREREFNQSEILCGRLAAASGKEIMTGNLVRNKRTRTQTEFDGQDRFSNVRGCFLVKDPGPLSGKHLLLVDDVLTTGATLSEAARALKKAGAAAVTALALAN